VSSQRSSFAEFGARVAARLEKGREVYGDRSFSRPPGELVAEIEQEILDICAWSYILFSRLHDLEHQVDGLDGLRVEVVPSREAEGRIPKSRETGGSGDYHLKRPADADRFADLLPEQQQDHDQQGRASVEDDLTDESTSRVVRTEELISGAPRADEDGEHDDHRQRGDAESTHVRASVTHAPVSPKPIGGSS
jgi:hypothetical protein